MIDIGFNLVYESYAKNDYRKKLRSRDEKYDLGKRRKDDRYWIYASEKISSLVLDHKSKNINEPRPYVYFVSKEELDNTFPKADSSRLDSKSYTRSEIDFYKNEM